MNRPRRLAVTAALLLLPAAARGQPAAPEPAALRGESAQTRKRLAEAEAKLLAGNAADAADALRRVLDEAGDDLITVDGKQFRPARWVAHQLLARLPPDALAAHRARIDGPARTLLDAGKRDRDPRPLWQLLDRYFVSTPADEASLFLGDLLFERGEFRTAEVVWRRLLPDADADVPYPHPQTDPAAVRARLVLAAAFQHEPDRARKELARLTERHPNATGPLAGVARPYAETLQPFLDHPPRVALDADDTGWPGFAGGSERSGRAAGRMPAYWPSRPTWVTDLPSGGRVTGTARSPFGHPVILNGRVYVSDGLRVYGFDLRTGRMAAVHTAGTAGQTGSPLTSLTAADGRLFARLGTPISPTFGRPPVVRKPDDAALVCFAPAEPDGPPARELWRVRPPGRGREAGRRLGGGPARGPRADVGRSCPVRRRPIEPLRRLLRPGRCSGPPGVDRGRVRRPDDRARGSAGTAHPRRAERGVLLEHGCCGRPRRGDRPAGLGVPLPAGQPAGHRPVPVAGRVRRRAGVRRPDRRRPGFRPRRGDRPLALGNRPD